MYKNVSETAFCAIRTRLQGIEGQHGVKIVHAAESGSRAWDMASSDSDYDVRFLFSRPIEQYVLLEPPRDVIESIEQVGHPARSPDPEMFEADFAGWDLRKTLKLLRKGNAVLLEWLNSPVVYKTCEWATMLREFTRTCFDARTCIWHYAGLAHRNYKSYIAGRDMVLCKKYLYICRALCSCIWVRRFGTVPPVSFTETLKGLEEVSGPMLPKGRIDEIKDLIRRKTAGEELAESPPLEEMNHWLSTQIREGLAKAESMKAQEKISFRLLDIFHIVAPGVMR